MSMSLEVEAARNADAVAALTLSQRAVYDECLRKDGSPRFALMLATQSPPGSRNTDRAFCQGQVQKMERMANRDKIIQIAQKAGIKTDGKFYMGGLGKYTNPAAWVSCAEDVITSCKMQNLGCEGAVNFKVPRQLEPEPPKSVPLSPELVAEMAHKEMKANPALAEKCRKSKRAQQELKEMVTAKYSKQQRRTGRKPKLAR